MTNDLVERLRMQIKYGVVVTATGAEAADRIEQLEAALEKARSIAKTGWMTANCSVIGDADYSAELCEYIADQIAALGEKKND